MFFMDSSYLCFNMDVGDNSICVVARNYPTILGRILEEGS
jgi:hypothetical protein